MKCEEPELVRDIFKTLDRELSTYRSDLLGVGEVLLGKGVTEQRIICTFLWKGNENHQLWTGFLVHQRIIPTVSKLSLLVIGCTI